MTESSGFEFQGIYYYQGHDDPAAFFYIPGNPIPEKDPSGKPTLNLWVSDQGAILQLGARWGVDADLLEDLRRHVAGQFPDLDPASIRLTPVMASIKEVALSLGDGTGKFTDLQTASSSGFPPFAAIFNVTLTAEQKTGAVAALNGREGFLRITYRGFLPSEVPVTVSISGDVTKEIAALGSNVTLEDCRNQMNTAIAAGRLKVDKSYPSGVSDDVLKEVVDLAKEKGAEILLKMASDLRAGFTPEESSLKVTVSRTERRALPIEPSTDVSAWFTAGRGPDHIRVLPTTVDSSRKASSGPVTVKVGFDPADAPIAFIQVGWGEAKATMRGPPFGPVTLKGSGSGEPLVIKTSYTDGGPSYESKVSSPGPEGWVLSPKDLGLANVVVDGTAQKQSGKKAVIHVHYRPSGKGTEDERSITFRFGDWVESWYVVTRNEGLDGVLEYDWKETAGDGSVTDHPTVTTDKPELKL
jgi:hypothetical protein